MPLPVFPVVGCSMPTVLHGLGIVLLYKTKGDLPNQRVITLNLAVAEFLYCFSRIIIYTVTPAVLLTKSTNAALHCLAGVFLCVIRFAILHVIIDRFLDIWLNLQYERYMNKNTLIKAIIIQWIVGFLVAAAVIILYKFKVINHDTIKLIRLSTDIIIIIAAFSTFAYLFSKVKSVLYGHNSQQHKQNKSTKVWLKLKIPLLMVSTFIAFNTSSSILWICWNDSDVVSHSDPIPRYYIYMLILDLLGWCSDALIYTFLQKRVRRLLAMSCKRTRRNQVRDLQTSLITRSVFP